MIPLLLRSKMNREMCVAEEREKEKKFNWGKVKIQEIGKTISYFPISLVGRNISMNFGVWLKSILLLFIYTALMCLLKLLAYDSSSLLSFCATGIYISLNFYLVL